MVVGKRIAEDEQMIQYLGPHRAPECNYSSSSSSIVKPDVEKKKEKKL